MADESPNQRWVTDDASLLNGFQQAGIQVPQFFCDDGDIEKRLTTGRDSMLVTAVTQCLNESVSIEPSNQATESTFVLVAEENSPSD